MSFVSERDDLRPEIRRGTAGVITYWIKVDGANATATTAFFSIFDSAGASLQAETSATIVAVSGVGSRLDLSIPAILTYQDGARIDVRFTVGTEHFDTMLFDVVRVPWVRSGGVSLNDMREERPDADVILDRIGQRLGYVAGDASQIASAALYAYRARCILDGWLRASSAAGGKLRAALIVDRRALARVERLLSIHALFASLAEAPLEGTDESSELSRYYEKAARDAYSSIPLAYDIDDDGVPDASPKAGAVYVRRVQ